MRKEAGHQLTSHSRVIHCPACSGLKETQSLKGQIRPRPQPLSTLCRQSLQLLPQARPPTAQGHKLAVEAQPTELQAPSMPAFPPRAGSPQLTWTIPAMMRPPRMQVQGWSPGESEEPPPTRADGQVCGDPLGADDVHSLALILALVMQGDGQDPLRAPIDRTRWRLSTDSWLPARWRRASVTRMLGQ